VIVEIVDCGGDG